MSEWFLYVLRTGDGALYTGVATDVRRRLAEHHAGRGSRYLRGRGPLAIVYQRKLGQRSLALCAEHSLKRRTKAQKEALVSAAPSRRRLLRFLGLA
jgi:putative endonuclease